MADPIRVQLTDLEAAWLAGLLEGEGYFCDSTHAKTKNCGCAIRLSMTDMDVVYRVFKMIPGGSFKAKQPPGNRQVVFHWSLYKRDWVLPVLKAILPHMGQ